MTIVLEALAGFSLGASHCTFCSCRRWNLYEAADVGADLVGKVEAGIPEDDPRNPATIADMLETMLVMLLEWVLTFLILCGHCPSGNGVRKLRHS